MKFKLLIDSGNEAMVTDAPDAVRVILADISNRIRHGYTHGKCMDINGGSVGSWELEV